MLFVDVANQARQNQRCAQAWSSYLEASERSQITSRADKAINFSSKGAHLRETERRGNAKEHNKTQYIFSQYVSSFYFRKLSSYLDTYFISHIVINFKSVLIINIL